MFLISGSFLEQDIKNNHCKLLFDFTSESYDITYKYFGNRDFTHKIICNTMLKYNLNKNDVILIVGKKWTSPKTLKEGIVHLVVAVYKLSKGLRH